MIQEQNSTNANEVEASSRDRQSRIILKLLTAADAISAFKGRTASEVFANEESKRAFIKTLTYDEFIELLNGINGVLRNVPKETWSQDGENVVLEGGDANYFPPLSSDKPELLNKTFQAIQTMNDGEAPLENIALLLATSLTVIHPYNDANGRTGRLSYLLLTRDLNEETTREIADALSAQGRFRLQLYPEQIEHPIKQIFRKEIGVIWRKELPAASDSIISVDGDPLNLPPNVNLTEKEIDWLKSHLEDEYFFWAVYTHIKSWPDFESYLMRRTPRGQRISMPLLFPRLTSADLEQIMTTFWDYKKRYAELVIDCLANPDKPEYQLSVDGETLTIQDYLKQKISEG